MSDTIRKRRENGRRFDAARASWSVLDVGICPACHGAGLINYEDAALPCPMCRPDEAREAAREATP